MQDGNGKVANSAAFNLTRLNAGSFLESGSEKDLDGVKGALKVAAGKNPEAARDLAVELADNALQSDSPYADALRFVSVAALLFVADQQLVRSDAATTVETALAFLHQPFANANNLQALTLEKLAELSTGPDLRVTAREATFDRGGEDFGHVIQHAHKATGFPEKLVLNRLTNKGHGHYDNIAQATGPAVFFVPNVQSPSVGA